MAASVSTMLVSAVLAAVFSVSTVSSAAVVTPMSKSLVNGSTFEELDVSEGSRDLLVTATIGPKDLDDIRKSADLRFNLVAPEELSNSTEIFRDESPEVIVDSEYVEDSEFNLGTPGEFESDEIFEGDIERFLFLSCNPTLRKGVTFSWHLWPKRNGVPIVDYRIGDTGVDESLIEEAIAHYHQHTCIRFERTGWLHFGPHVVFGNRGGGCYSSVGRQFLSLFGGQLLSLASGCSRLSIVVHEIGHALGMYHEQSRSDRDDHVQVILENIQSGKERNFDKRNTCNYDTAYDYTSVMHYGPLSFSENGDTTLASSDPLAHGLMVLPRTGLTFMDKLQLNSMYECSDYWLSKCEGLSSSPCKNLGYLREDCKCECPEGTSGDNCETKTMSYTDALIAKYLTLNEVLDAPGDVTSPNYPTPQQNLVVFTKVIEAPSCKRVVLTVTGFNTAGRSSRGRCSTEGVEIRLDDPVTSGKWYCGTELTAGQRLESKGSTLVLFYMKAKTTYNTKPGFSFRVTFEPITGCSKVD